MPFAIVSQNQMVTSVKLVILLELYDKCTNNWFLKKHFNHSLYIFTSNTAALVVYKIVIIRDELAFFSACYRIWQWIAIKRNIKRRSILSQFAFGIYITYWFHVLTLNELECIKEHKKKPFRLSRCFFIPHSKLNGSQATMLLCICIESIHFVLIVTWHWFIGNELTNTLCIRTRNGQASNFPFFFCKSNSKRSKTC